MIELYWITRLNAINAVLLTSAVIALAFFVVALFIVAQPETSKEGKKELRGTIIKSGVIGVVFLLLSVFTPTTREALVIYGVGGTLDYIKNDSTLQAMPQKVVQACDAYLDNTIKNNQEKE